MGVRIPTAISLYPNFSKLFSPFLLAFSSLPSLPPPPTPPRLGCLSPLRRSSLSLSVVLGSGDDVGIHPPLVSAFHSPLVAAPWPAPL
ncbi:hypothetical protein V6N13_040243 [Hibiscus sabdariffa]